MTAPPPDLAARIAAFLSEQTGGPVAVHELQPLPGGACQDHYQLRCTFAAGEFAGERRLVLRSDARSRILNSLTRREEHAVIQAARAAGVRTPAARFLGQDLLRPGAWSYFMDLLPGEALGSRVVRGPELHAARAGLPGELARELARIHRVGPGADLPLRRPGEAGAVAAELALVEELLCGLAEPHPALELAFLWLRRHVPAADEVVLVHGDFRTGNFLVTPAGLEAVLDWEFAHFGSPYEDLAWLCVRDWRFGQLRLPAGGLCRREVFYAAYERESGRQVDPETVRYFEVLGNVRWALGCVHQGQRYLSGTESDLELIAIARRAAEMEWEALRLISLGRSTNLAK